MFHRILFVHFPSNKVPNIVNNSLKLVLNSKATLSLLHLWQSSRKETLNQKKRNWPCFIDLGALRATVLHLAAGLQINKTPQPETKKRLSSVVFPTAAKVKGLPTYISVQLAASPRNRSGVKLHWLGVTNYWGYRTVSTLVETWLDINWESYPYCVNAHHKRMVI